MFWILKVHQEKSEHTVYKIFFFKAIIWSITSSGRMIAAIKDKLFLISVVFSTKKENKNSSVYVH